MKSLATFIAAFLLSVSASADIMVNNPYARAVAPGQSMSASFMTLMNHSATEVSLISAQSSVAESVELHAHKHEDGVMKMRRIPQITLQANETVELKPGGLHIMLFGLKQDLQAGEKIDLKLNFSDGTSQALTIPVQPVMAAMGKKHSQ